eukprot:SAG11_NODE_3124_length_2669_cov_1.558366_2_plen_212_part_00
MPPPTVTARWCVVRHTAVKRGAGRLPPRDRIVCVTQDLSVHHLATQGIFAALNFISPNETELVAICAGLGLTDAGAADADVETLAGQLASHLASLGGGDGGEPDDYVHDRSQKHVVLTRGERGLLLSSCAPGDAAPSLRWLELEGGAVEMVDCTGAGDTLVGATIAALGVGNALPAALRFGMRAAALTVQSHASVSPLIGAAPKQGGLRLT